MRESINNFFEDHNFLTAAIIIATIGALPHFSGLATMVHDFVDIFWKAKGF